MNLYNFHEKPASLDHHADAPDLVPKLAWEKYQGNVVELRKREALWARDATCAYWYALHILKGPFPAGEAAIAKDTVRARLYANYILKAPFPTGEAAIAKDGVQAYLYAEHVLKGPFPAGEKAIMSSVYSEEYLELIGKK